ncbi:hypothetical protein E2320_022889, partial [Naja naja]
TKQILYEKEEEDQRWDPLAYASCPRPPPYNQEAIEEAVGGGDVSATKQYQELKRELDTMELNAESQPTTSSGAVTRSKAKKENRLQLLREMPNGMSDTGAPVTTFAAVSVSKPPWLPRGMNLKRQL